MGNTRRTWLLATLAICTALTACKTELDLNTSPDIPEDRALAATISIENQLQSVYALMADSHLYGGSFYLWPTIISDAAKSTLNSEESAIYRREFSPQDKLINLAWLNAYRAINRCNLIIDRCRRQDGDAEYGANQRRLLGEALCLRSILYFDLARLFAPQYAPATQGLPAVVLVLAPATGRNAQAPATVGQVYTQIQADLREAAGLLPETDFDDRTLPFNTPFTGVGHVTAGTALGYLAKSYFQQNQPADYGTTVDIITLAIDSVKRINVVTDLSNFATPPFPRKHPLVIGTNRINLFGQKGAQLPTNGTLKTVPSESLFQILSSTQILNQRRSTYLTVKLSYVPGVPILENPEYIISDEIRGPQEGATRDLFVSQGPRYSDFYAPSRVGFFPVRKFNQSLEINYPLLRSAELLLSRAEVQALRNQGEDLLDAASDMYLIKYRAGFASGGTPTPRSPGYLNAITNLNRIARNGIAGDLPSRDTLLAEIRRERIRELLFEPDRLYDLKRRGLDIPATSDRPSVPAAPLHLPIPEIETRENLAL